MASLVLVANVWLLDVSSFSLSFNVGYLSSNRFDGKRETLTYIFALRGEQISPTIQCPAVQVITDHGPQAEVARVFGHELLVDSGEGRLEGLEEEQQKERKRRRVKRTTTTQRTDDHACME